MSAGSTSAAIESMRRSPEEALAHVAPGDDLIVGLGNAEPVAIMDALEAGADALRDVRVHRMLALRERSYMHGDFAGLRHMSWFLSPADRGTFGNGTCDLV